MVEKYSVQPVCTVRKIENELFFIHSVHGSKLNLNSMSETTHYVLAYKQDSVGQKRSKF